MRLCHCALALAGCFRGGEGGGDYAVLIEDVACSRVDSRTTEVTGTVDVFMRDPNDVHLSVSSDAFPIAGRIESTVVDCGTWIPEDAGCARQAGDRSIETIGFTITTMVDSLPEQVTIELKAIVVSLLGAPPTVDFAELLCD